MALAETVAAFGGLGSPRVEGKALTKPGRSAL